MKTLSTLGLRAPALGLLLYLGLTVAVRAQTAPAITSQPLSQSVNLRANATFTVSASGSTPLFFQWFFNGQLIQGATNPSLPLVSVGNAQAGIYSVAVSNSVGGVTSSPATLTVVQVPEVLPPAPSAGYAGGIPYQYTISASNSPASFYATGLPPGLSVNTATGVISGSPTLAGTYPVTVTATNSLGTSGSVIFNVQINPQPYYTARLAATVGTMAGIAVDINGNIFAAGGTSNTISRVTASGTVTIIAGSSGQSGYVDGSGNLARFNNPTGVALDSAGNIYVSDTNNQLIRKITPIGTVSTIAGTYGQIGSNDGLGLNARFNYPQGLAVDGTGNVFIADSLNSTIREITPAGIVLTFAGLAGQTGSVDGIGGAARFSNPTAVAVDPAGIVFVLDSGNYSLRKISSAANVTTVARQLSETSTFGSGIVPPNWIAVDNSDNVLLTIGPGQIFVNSDAVWQVSPQSVVSIPFSWRGGVQGLLAGILNPGDPTGIAADSFGKLYLALPSGIYTYAPVTGPTILTQPQSQSVAPGQSCTFSVSVASTVPPTYQWQQDGVNIPASKNASAATSTLALPSVGTTNSTYSVVISTPYSIVTSNGAFLTVNSPNGPAPTISSQPQSITVNALGVVALTVTPSDSAPIGYQWFKNGIALSGANSATLLLSNITSANAGSYTVVLSRSGGSVTSAPATLTVSNGQVSRISNLSVRTNLASAQDLIVGFITSGPKNLLIRASGPGLNPYGVTNFYADPKFTVFNGSGTALAQNDDWSSSLSPTFSSVGAFPLTPGSKDAALVNSLTGPNTAVANGTGSGIMLVEVYDTDPSSSTAKLVNVSARNQVGTGANILISGFVVDGTAARTLLIRGVGPALNDFFGVSGQLADPLLEIHQMVNGQDTLIASNDNWDASLTPLFDQVGAFRFLAGSKDAALVITLPPGIYSAELYGVNGGTGDGLIELYVVGP
jgi:Putative Ig domain/NHL repeat